MTLYVLEYVKSLNLPKLTYQECASSLTTKTLFLLERELEIHVNTKETSFLIQQMKLEVQWLTNTNNAYLPPRSKLGSTQEIALTNYTNTL